MKFAERKSQKHISVATSETCYIISTGPNIFVFIIQIAARNLFIKNHFNCYGANLTSSLQFQAIADLQCLP